MSAPVTVIIVTYNSRRWFERQAMALRGQTYQGFDLIVWDNASEPDQRPQSRDFPAGAQIVGSLSNLGFAVANNRAAALAEGSDFYVLLNPDAFPEPTWLEELLAAASRYPNAAAFGSTQIDAENPARFDGLGDAYHAIGLPWRGGHGHLRGTQEPLEGETFSACAAAALYRGAAWREAGGFDETFFSYGEDVDLGFRLRLLGYTVVQAARAVVHHVGGASAARRSAFATYYGRRNRLWTFVKNMPAPLFWAIGPAQLALAIAPLMVAIGKPTFAPTWRALRDGFTGLKVVWRQRRLTQAQRRASLWGIAAAFAWSPLAPAQRTPVIRRPREASAPPAGTPRTREIRDRGSRSE